jgi:dihydroorotate dehydrogenase
VNKEEEFSGFMKDMRPGNSSPQIFVVSVNNSVENRLSLQDYGWRVDISNSVC